MTSTEFHQFEHAFWNKAAVPYDGGIGAVTAQVTQPLLESAGCKPGINILDIACGPGYLCAAAIRSGAHATGIDFSTSMIALAKQSVPNVDFKVGDAQALPFDDNSFDAVVCAFGLMHFSDPLLALREAYRVCKTGGRYTYAVWSAPEKSRMIEILTGAIKRHTAPVPSQPEGLPFFKFADVAESAQVMKQAGFKNFTSQDVEFVWSVLSATHLIESFKDGGARIGGVLRAQAPETLSSIEADIQSRIDAYKTGSGYNVPVSIFFATGIKQPEKLTP